MLKQITLRGIPDRLEKVIRKAAREKRWSLNRTILDLLDRAYGGHMAPSDRGKKRDLDRFFGIWSKSEADRFDKTLKEQRQIDRELWK